VIIVFQYDVLLGYWWRLHGDVLIIWLQMLTIPEL